MSAEATNSSIESVDSQFVAGSMSRFDLSKVAEARYRELRVPRIAATIVTVFVSGLEVLTAFRFAGLVPRNGVTFDDQFLFILAGGLVIIGMSLGFLFTQFSVRPANWLVIDSSGVSLQFPEGRVRRFSWHDRRAVLALVDQTRIRPRFAQGGRPPEQHFQILGFRPRYSPITEGAFNEILSTARASGAVVTFRERARSPFHERVYRISHE